MNGGEVWFYASVLTWFWAWLALRRRAVRVVEPPPDVLLRSRPIRRMVGEGALAFAVLASGLAVVGLMFGLVVVDSGAARLGMVIGFPVMGFSFGAALADGAMGGALASLSGHSSLLHFGLPAGPESGAAPVWLFAAVLLAPAVVASAVWRRLDRDRPADEQRVLASGAAVAAGFAGAAWLAALVGRVTLIAYVGPTLEGGWFSPSPEELRRILHGAVVTARPNPASVLGLGLMWGLAGGLGAAFLWASRHNAPWLIAGTAAASAPASPPAGTAWLLPESPPEAPGTAPGPDQGQEGAGPAGGAAPPGEKP